MKSLSIMIAKIEIPISIALIGYYFAYLQKISFTVDNVINSIYYCNVNELLEIAKIPTS